AECYVRLSDPLSAEKWYASLVEHDSIPSAVKFEYAEVLLGIGRNFDAQKWYEIYAKEAPNDPLPKEKIEFIKRQKHYVHDSVSFRVVPANINSIHSDFGAAYFRKGLVFVSSRDQDLFIKRESLSSLTEDEAMLNLFHAEKQNENTYGPVKLFGNNKISLYHDGPIAFYDNYTKAAFTRNSHVHIKNGNKMRMNLHLFFADVDPSGALSNIKPFVYNFENYSSAHASFSKDGKVMFFASDMPHGFGGSDIYYCLNKNGEWGEPINAGPNVNTPGEELYPFIYNDSTLYFSSTGHGGFGGLDNFISFQRKGKFRRAYNLGYSLNTPYDDFGVVTDSTGRVGYMSSNRSGGMGLDDIYFFVSSRFFAIGQTRELGNLTNIVKGASIMVKDLKGNLVDSTKSDEDGYFNLDLPLDQDFSISASKEGYDMLEDVGYSTRGRYLGVDSLLFPLWKHTLYVKGKVYSNETNTFLPGATVLLENQTENKIDSVKVGDDGQYSFLVFPNKKYHIHVRKRGYIPAGFDISTKDLYKGELLNDVVLEEVYVEKDTIHFGYNKFDVTEASAKLMDKIARTLKKYPNTTLTIRAHADSRGAAWYNDFLSNERAQALVKYFTDKGIAKKRINAKGFGETLLLNRCRDGVTCTEQEHAVNRRAEVKVQDIPAH
ncbi:MAG TPA: hypothetical protein DGG95_11935, partial [Cytophagales bacterium]|nr:hypothetical protein [Cytophagales bacterium]